MNTPTLSPKEFEKDPRYARVVRTMEQYQYKHSGLIQILHSIQELYGYLPMDLIKQVAADMRISPSRIYGVATFYHFFRLKPAGEHSCLVCTGTACYVKGTQKILDFFKEKKSLLPGETTKNNKLGLQTARCIGACGLAPAVVMDGEILPKVDVSKMETVLNKVFRESDG